MKFRGTLGNCVDDNRAEATQVAMYQDRFRSNVRNLCFMF